MNNHDMDFSEWDHEAIFDWLILNHPEPRKPASPRWKAVLHINHIEQRAFQYTHTGGWEECIGVLSWLVWRRSSPVDSSGAALVVARISSSTAVDDEDRSVVSPLESHLQPRLKIRRSASGRSASSAHAGFFPLARLARSVVSSSTTRGIRFDCYKRRTKR
jgi:hypothetical protein